MILNRWSPASTGNLRFLLACTWFRMVSTGVYRGKQREHTHTHPVGLRQKQSNQPVLANLYLLSSFSTPYHPSSMESCIHQWFLGRLRYNSYSSFVISEQECCKCICDELQKKGNKLHRPSFRCKWTVEVGLGMKNDSSVDLEILFFFFFYMYLNKSFINFM